MRAAIKARHKKTRTREKQKRATSTTLLAMWEKPKRPTIKATSRKINVHINIVNSLVGAYITSLLALVLFIPLWIIGY
jgi:hypothetical protein